MLSKDTTDVLSRPPKSEDVRQESTPEGPVALLVSTRGSALKPTDRHVYMAIVLRAGGPEGICWASRDTLAWDTGLSVSGVRGSLRRLVTAGAVEVERRHGMSSLIHPRRLGPPATPAPASAWQRSPERGAAGDTNPGLQETGAAGDMGQQVTPTRGTSCHQPGARGDP